MKTKLVFLLLLPLVMPIVRCKQDEMIKDPPPKIYSLPFYVYEAGTNDPLHGAEVFFVNHLPGFYGHKVYTSIGATDSEGFFEWEIDSISLAEWSADYTSYPGPSPHLDFMFSIDGYLGKDLTFPQILLADPGAWPEKIEVFLEPDAESWVHWKITYTGGLKFDKIIAGIEAPSVGCYCGSSFDEWVYYNPMDTISVDTMPGSQYSITLQAAYGYTNYAVLSLYEKLASPGGDQNTLIYQERINSIAPAWDTLHLERVF